MKTAQTLHDMCLLLETGRRTDMKLWAQRRILELEISEYPVYIDIYDNWNKRHTLAFLTEEDREEASEYLKTRYFN